MCRQLTMRFLKRELNFLVSQPRKRRRFPRHKETVKKRLHHLRSFFLSLERKSESFRWMLAGNRRGRLRLDTIISRERKCSKGTYITAIMERYFQDFITFEGFTTGCDEYLAFSFPIFLFHC